MHFRNLFAACFLVCMGITNLYGQAVLSGTVKTASGIRVAGATVSDTLGHIAVSDSMGNFRINDIRFPVMLITTHPQYDTDTLELTEGRFAEIILGKIRQIRGVTLSASGSGNLGMSGMDIKTEVITKGELKKAACCDLAGCFETQATVLPMTTNVLTNAKELRILGLSGVYNQILIDGIPLLQGLTYTFGVSSIPGTFVQNIMVSKGSNSVLQGFENMAGQINVITEAPEKGEKLFVNMYVNSFGENQHNLNYRSGKSKWKNILALHAVQPAGKWDRDRDGFMDLPRLRRFLFWDKFTFGDERKKGWALMFSVKGFSESRSGGQVAFNERTLKGNDSIYGQFINYLQGEVYAKAAYRLNDDERVVMLASASVHDQNSWYGTLSYKGLQHQGYANIQYERTWRQKHELKTGVSHRMLNIREDIAFSDTMIPRTFAGRYLKNEHIAGVFAENVFSWKGDIITLITGLRADHHNRFGWNVTPRALLKYDITERFIVRTSAGTGWRTANLFSENTGLMASSRNIIFIENLRPEKSLNWGINILQQFKKKMFDGYFSADFYSTRFSNQFFPDYDTDPQLALIANFTGTSVSNGFQADLNFRFNKIWEVKSAYNFLDVYRMVDGKKKLLPFNPRHRVMLAVSWLPAGKKWRCDVINHWYGEQRLPETGKNPLEYRQAGFSRPYSTFNLQITRNWKQFEVYAGCENLFDYRQLRPLVSWQNPFSPYFDTSFNWGPTRGREVYLGFRWKLN